MDPALLHKPLNPTGDGVLLTHGAGGNCRSELLIAVAHALQDVGLLVVRYDLPFRQARKFGPPQPAHAAQDRAGLQTALAEMRPLVPGKLLLGGHSYGGRQASILLSEEAGVADGLMLLSYPLHPPKKPQQLRTAHFPKLHAPALFVHGTADPFGSVEEMTEALPALAGIWQLSVVDGAGHDLKRGRFDMARTIVDRLRILMELR